MKTLLLASALLLTGTSAFAESFTCSFTEPFYTFTYSTDSKILVLKDDAENKVLKTVRGVDFKIVGPEEFSLRDARGKEIANLKLTFKGSDGMSENEFPYEVKTNVFGDRGANNGVGGCASSLLKVKESDRG